MSTYFITGTSRGIGLELTKQLLEMPKTQVTTVVAVTRSESEALKALIEKHPGRVINLIIKDLSSDDAVQKALTELQAQGVSAIDVLINNAGAMPFHPEGAKTISGDALREIFNTNVVSAQVVTAAFLPLLERGKEKKVIAM
jgi:short-subunit dehydrogenase